MAHDTRENIKRLRGKDDENRIRVARILNGTCRPSDLSAILRSLRAKTHGNYSIRDLGDFTAHEDGRDEGMICEAVEEMAHASRFQMFIIDHKGKPLPYLPPFAQQAIYANFVNLKNSFSREDYGIRYKDAYRMVTSFLKRLTPRPDGNLDFPANMSHDESDLLSRISGSLTIRSAYDQDSLIASFSDVLLKNRLVTDAEAAFVKSEFSDRLAVFAISAMHRVQLVLTDHSVCILNLRRSGGDPQSLSVTASWPITLSGVTGNVEFAADVFTTRLEPKDWLSDDLGVASDLSEPAEIGDDWKMHPMR